MRASLIALAAFALDRWSKFLVDTRLQPYQSHTVIPGFFDIVRSNNTGVAFGLFAGAASGRRVALLLGFSAAALLVLIWLLVRTSGADTLSATAVALIFGGAAGNVYDRIRAGSVTDFLDFYIGSYHWYTFNLADTAITIGAGLLLFGMIRRSPAERKAGH